MLATLETFALELAAAAAAETLPRFRTGLRADDKGPAGAYDPVTEADRSAEAAIRRAVAARFPDHGVIGEEYGEDRPDAEFVWVLDPVDGTRAFIAGLPLWTTLIALRVRGEPAVGVIAQPHLDETFVGTAAGSRLISAGRPDRPLAVRPCPAIAEAVIATTDPDLFRAEEADAWRRLRGAARLARFGCDAYAYAMVALGELDAVVETGLKSWDVEAAVPLLAGAGGHVCDWTGQPIGREGGRLLLAGDRRVVEAASAMLTA